jgi:hypothetical protein
MYFTFWLFFPLSCPTIRKLDRNLLFFFFFFFFLAGQPKIKYALFADSSRKWRIQGSPLFGDGGLRPGSRFVLFFLFFFLFCLLFFI